MYNDFHALDRWSKKQVHCIYQALIVAIATRHADAVDIKFLVDGRPVWMRESGVVLAEHGRPVALRGILLDITRQKRDAEQLDKLNRQLIDTSRQAGMADVATGVLHNVGNVLNSVSVATTVVADRLRRSKVASLRKATAMLSEQNGRLADFLTADPKGKLLPAYLGTIADQLADEQLKLIAKMESVAENIEHIKEIVAMQQNCAKLADERGTPNTTFLVKAAKRKTAGVTRRRNTQIEVKQEPSVLVTTAGTIGGNGG